MNEADAGRIFQITRPHRRLLLLYLVRSLLAGPLFPLVLLPSFFKYQTLKYRFDNEGISMSWGILWHKEISLTYARIQDIHLSRGLLERWMGLATLEIQTASGSGSAEMGIVGLSQFEELRDFLYSKMRGARFGKEEEGGDTRNASAGSDAAASVLIEIRDELRALRQELGGRKP